MTYHRHWDCHVRANIWKTRNTPTPVHSPYDREKGNIKYQFIQVFQHSFTKLHLLAQERSDHHTVQARSRSVVQSHNLQFVRFVIVHRFRSYVLQTNADTTCTSLVCRWLLLVCYFLPVQLFVYISIYKMNN